jgi:hypothetical protein
MGASCRAALIHGLHHPYNCALLQFVNDEENSAENTPQSLRVAAYESPLDFRSPMVRVRQCDHHQGGVLYSTGYLTRMKLFNGLHQ